MKSRNQREGVYCGKINRKHNRSGSPLLSFKPVGLGCLKCIVESLRRYIV